jgi:phospholipid/cholesterol/gamma-HCH transport system substrate-binding protein
MKWSTEAKVGAFTLLGIILFSVMMVQVGNLVLFGKKGFEVTGYFLEAEGIEPGNPVHYAGVEVGRVDSIEVKNGEAVLGMRLYDGTEIPKDADFSIQTSSVMGGKYIKASGGHMDRGYLSEGMTVHGEAAGGIDKAMTKMDKLMDSAQTMMDGLNAVVADPKAQGSIKNTLSNIDTMTQNMAMLTAQGIAVANQVDGIASQVNQMMYQFNGDGKASADARTILANLAETSENAREMSVKAKEMSGKLDNAMSGENISAQGELLYNTHEHEFSPDFSLRLGKDRFFQIGVESLGNDSLLDAAFGVTRNDYYSFYGGVIRGKFGGGASYKKDKWTFNADLFDPDDLTMRVRAGYEVYPNVYAIGQSIFPHSRKGGGEYLGIGYIY